MSFTNNTTARAVLNQIVHDPRYADVMAVPKWSAPQIMLSSLALGGFTLSCIAYLNGSIPLLLAMLINLAAVYIAFTPLHDASHRAVSSNSRINDWLGVLTGQLLLPGVNMTTFRAIHMDHHRYTGEEGRDPDTGFVSPPKWAGLAYLMFADLHWVYWYFRYGRKIWSRRVSISLYLMLAAVVVSHAAFLLSPWWKEFLLLYVIPQRVGLGVVAYTFAHIQHPEGLTWENEPFQSTMYMKGNSPLRRLLFGQEDHAIHHLVPHIPWFKYRQVWALANGVLRRQNIPGRSWVAGPSEIVLPKAEDTAAIPMRVAQIRDVGEGIRAFEFEPLNGSALKAGEAGAHLDVHLPNGLVRQYSLINHDVAANRYRIAVKCEEQGRGGSKAMHGLVVGDEVKVGPLRNNFVLYENASDFILIAGGIGLTPLLSMANRLQEINKPFSLHLCARNQAAIPFVDEIKQGALAVKTEVHLDGEDGRSSLNVDVVLGKPNDQTLVYICGPQGFMNWLKSAALAKGWKEENIRIESFSAPVSDATDNHAFTVTMAKSGQVVQVDPSQTVIDALHHAGLDVPYACMQGTCGTCTTEVVEGEVDHRDAYLSESEKAEGKTMCLCVSRARGENLTVNL